ncbi:MAG: LysR family transcriptional regulator [Achromobacter sp.]|nr:LysR family transcriptional regulator [Achromobacter sp.]
MKLVVRAADELKMENVSAFVATAESGSFSQAAVMRGCSQSMLSRRVLELEELLGGRLFNRTGRGVLLTELGVALLPVAQGCWTAPPASWNWLPPPTSSRPARSRSRCRGGPLKDPWRRW